MLSSVMSKDTSEKLTAIDLLHAYLELRCMEPDLEKWTPDSCAPGTSWAARLQQLAALFRAFDLPWEPQAFADGKLIDPASSRYQDWLAKNSAATASGGTRARPNDSARLGR
jgi:hypothetical protein